MTWTRAAEIAQVGSFALALLLAISALWPQFRVWRMFNWRANLFFVFLVLGIMFAGLQYYTSALFLGQMPTPQMTQPSLNGEIEGIVVGSQHPRPGAVITLFAHIRNLGTPSVVGAWSLSVVLPNGQTFSAPPYPIPETVVLHREGDSPVTVYGEDALYNKTATTPIPTGGLQRGVLLFLLNQVERHVVGQPGTRIILHYQDVTNRPYSIEESLGEITRAVPFLPGLRTR